MSTLKVLFTGCTFSKEKLNELKDKGIEITSGRMDYNEEELINILKDYDCYINGGDEICTKKVIESNPQLKLITFMGTGYQKYIDVETAKRFNIPVSYTPSANAKAVAEYTVALILDSVKKITYSNNQVRDKEWNKVKTFNLENKVLGIVGMGAIGTHIAKILCDGFGMKLIYNSRTNKPEVDRKYNTNMVSLKELFEQADVISVNATYTKENEKMINEAILKNIKDNAIIVNTARQELIDKEYLYSILEKGKINAVAMDGFYIEPITSETNDKYLELSEDKYLLTPHNAYNSSDAVLEMERMIVESLEDLINNKKIRNVVE